MRQSLRRQLLLSSTVLVAAVTGYGRSAYAACAPIGGGQYQCSGANVATQTINANNAEVFTVPGFSVDTSAGPPLSDAVHITGDGALSYTDTNASALTSNFNALYVFSYGNDGATDGSVAIQTNGDLVGDATGISAANAGAGALSIIATGRVEGTLDVGIDVRNLAAASHLTVTTEGTVVGTNAGIDAFNQGSGDTSVTANGNVSAIGGSFAVGISAQNGTAITPAGRNLTITTGAGSNVTGDVYGVAAYNYGSGALKVTANGDVTGMGRYGIFARNGTNSTPAGTSLTVTTGADSTITGLALGISARNYGSGALDITVKGDVTGKGGGVFALNRATSTGDLTVTTAAGSNVTGTGDGIAAGNLAGTVLKITANGDVTSGTADGIDAISAGGPIAIAVGAASHVTSNSTIPTAFAVDASGGPTGLTVAGTLNGGAGGAVSFDQTAALDDRLELHPTATINGTVFAGPGDDTLAFGGSGNGVFDLGAIGNGAQQYRDFETFQVEGGTWSFAGATTAPFTINGGTMMGTGTFGGLAVNGGVLAPGNSIGTITVNGPFTLGPGAVFEVEVNAKGQNDQVIVNGTVNLTGATLRVLDANGNYKPKTDYVIIENDGSDAVKGEFANVTNTLAFLTPTVVYDGGTGNDVVLTLIRTTSDFCSVAQTRNQCNVALALDQFPTDNPLFLAVLNQTAEGARTAFDALSGEIHATLSGVLADDSRYVREAILGRLMQANLSGAGDLQVASLAAAGPQVASLDAGAMAVGYDDKALGANMPAPAPLAFWTRAYGAWGDFDGDGNAATADRDLGGFVSGMDATLSGSWRIGLATGASFANVDVNDRFSSADVESFLLAGYTGGMAGPLALRGGGAWAWNDIDTSRAVIFPGFFERQAASYDADTGQIFGEVAYPTQMGGIALEPFAGLAYVAIDTDRFREHGGALASLRGSSDQDVGYSTLGLRAATTMHWGVTLVVPHVSAAWQHAFDDVTPGASLTFASTGIGFTVYGVPLAEDSALIDAGLDFALGTNTTAGVSYSGQFGDGVTDNAVKGRFTWLF